MFNNFKIKSGRIVAVMAVILCAFYCLNGCSFKQDSMAQFKTLPDEGWNKTMPISFEPEYSDSSTTYDIALAIRHNNDYQYSNLSLIVDLIDSVMYQSSVVIAQNVTPNQVNTIVVWQAMNNCDVIKNVMDIGIVITPSK